MLVCGVGSTSQTFFEIFLKVPSLARSVPKPLKVPSLARSMPKPLKMPSLARSVAKPLKVPSLARSVAVRRMKIISCSKVFKRPQTKILAPALLTFLH